MQDTTPPPAALDVRGAMKPPELSAMQSRSSMVISLRYGSGVIVTHDCPGTVYITIGMPTDRAIVGSVSVRLRGRRVALRKKVGPRRHLSPGRVYVRLARALVSGPGRPWGQGHRAHGSQRRDAPGPERSPSPPGRGVGVRGTEPSPRPHPRPLSRGERGEDRVSSPEPGDGRAARRPRAPARGENAGVFGPHAVSTFMRREGQPGHETGHEHSDSEPGSASA